MRSQGTPVTPLTLARQLPEDVVPTRTGKNRYVPSPKRKEEQYCGRSVVMVESPAHRLLSIAALRVLYRIEIELSNHGGNDNGKLPVTFAQLEELGVRRHTAASAIRGLEALGFIEITHRGYGGSAGQRSPNLYRLTYKPTHRLSKNERNDATNEWRKIKTVHEADAIATRARKAANPHNVERARKFVTPRSDSVSPYKKGDRNDPPRPTKQGLLRHPRNGEYYHSRVQATLCTL